jgi:topoisomerase-4 subunit A
MEIKMGRILKFNTDKSNAIIAQYKEDIAKIDYHLAHIVEYTIDWFVMLKEKYGQSYPRLTEVRNFDTIEATKVVEANEKLYINRTEGFIGTGLKKDEFVCNCSDIDDVILFYRNGTYKVVKVSEKMFVGKDIIYLNVFKRNDNRTIYNVIYRDGKAGFNHIKRFAVTGVTRDREYDVTKGTQGSRILYFSANMNGEAETVKVILKPKPRQKLLVFEKDFSEVAIKGRGSMGNLLTKAEIHKISLKQKGSSTLGGRMVWFDRDILRLNYDGRGEELGEFQSEDLILIVLQNGEFYTTNFDLSNHYEDNILVIEKNDSMKVWTAVYYDADQKYFYLKRFLLEGTVRKQNFLGENPKNRLMLLTDEVYPRIEVVFGGHDAFREPLVLDAEEFIGVKGFKAKGKRISTFEIEVINELDPIRFAPKIDQEQEEREEEEAVTEIESEKSNTDIIDEITGQMKLFDE